LLFSDVEGSTKLLEALGESAYAKALDEHRQLLRSAFGAYGGTEIDTQGDAFLYTFPKAADAAAAAAAAQTALSPGPIRVRMGLHTGEPLLTEEGYVGMDVHRAARIAACGHGGQVLISASTSSLLSSTCLRDLGDHRLKDLSAPERIYQLGNGDFPPLKSLHNTNLPVPPTSFVGRDREVAEVAALLGDDDTRLITLTGPGGSGKTRLALQSAGAVADSFDAGVWWVSLAPLRDPALMFDTAAHSLGAKSSLAQHIGRDRMLLLLDNFEHLIAAGQELAQLLAECPHLTVLVTSREPLRLEGEWEYSVDPLSQPEAVALFESRAQAVQHGWKGNGDVRQICNRLDNLPLAIELAAARVKILSPAALLNRLERRLPILSGGPRNAPERQKTLRATIEWSHELLTPSEQTLFSYLGVFAGGATLASIETVCRADLDILASLVDKSLVRVRDGERYWMLETIREFAAEQLVAGGELDLLHRRHADHYVALAEEAEPQLRAGPKEWIDRLDDEHDNFRVALDWLEAAADTQLVLRLAGALSRFWYLRGYLPEGQHRLERALNSDTDATAARAKALDGMALLSMAQDPAIARALAQQALELHRSLGDTWGQAYSVFLLTDAEAQQGRLEYAQRLSEESARTFGEIGDEQLALLASRDLAWICTVLGEHDRAKRLHEENLQRARALSNERVEASTLQAMARYAFDGGRIEEARLMLKQSLRRWQELGNLLEIAVTLIEIAAVLAREGSATIGAQLLSRAKALYAQIGATAPWWARTWDEQTLDAIRKELGEGAIEEASQEGQALTIDGAVTVALEALG
jgi:predicted ATPase